MKVSCLQDNLQRALAQVSRAVASKTALPVLSNVLLATDEGRLRIAATNLEIGITTWIGASVDEEGKVTVDARLLNEFVNTLPNAPVQLAVESPRMTLSVQSGRDKAGINGIDAEDFPVIPRLDGDAFVAEVDPQVLREMISQVEFAAATDESRPVLAGVLARFEGSTLVLAAADGFRLAVREGELASPVPERLDIILPGRALRELARIIGDQTEPVRLAITASKSQLLVRVGETEFLSRLIEGTFPDFRQIIPREFNTRLEMSRDAFQNAVRRASYFARDNNDVVRLTIHPGEEEFMPGSVEVSATAAERGSSQSFVDASVTGPETQIAFNARYLADVLGVLKNGKVMIGMNGANQAGVVRSAEAEDYTHVIMPMVIGAQ
ncbi:MAG: DNA polymerase III subunit beta [Chloroflexota bacterium]|nr:DNA polymerase III subunit beta [Chloroflexota bacterium]MDP9470603.1 DNA polymerase III subunit beta [Chloroflexota bacterium]